MDRTDTKVKTSMRNFLLALALLLITNILMGVTLMTLSKITLREQIDQRMLDVANTAARQLNGDDLKTLKAQDVGTEAYDSALETLRSFQDSIELDYIYGIRAESDGTFTFTIDPAEEDPGEFGSLIVTTPALQQAANGTPSVDKKAYSDAWGRFYSAYSPVFDSNGDVAGIVGVDFNAEWYDGKINSHRAIAVIIAMVAMTIGIVLSFTIMSQNRKRFSAMLQQLSTLSKETERLDRIIMQSSIKKLDLLPESDSAVLKTLATGVTHSRHSSDEYEAMNTSIEAVYTKLHSYLKYIDSEVYTDDTTGVNNKAAYRNKIKELDESILAGNAVFSMAFFDINGIKKIYVHYGFEAGEKLMYECAKLLKEVFGEKNIYHITGDEFIVIMEKKGRLDMREYLTKFETALKQYNDEHIQDNQLSVAKGYVTYDSEKHSNYRQVFIEVKAACDKDKDEYYGRTSALN